MSTEIIHIEESEYNSILLQAVAVIDKARTNAAKSVSCIANTAYWEIGKLLYEKKLDSGYGNRVVERLSVDLKQLYPSMGLSPRNLWDRNASMFASLKAMKNCDRLSQFCLGRIT